MTNGEVVPVWVKEDSSKIPLSAFVSGTYLYIATDSEAYVKKNPSEKRGRFLIEPTN